MRWRCPVCVVQVVALNKIDVATPEQLGRSREQLRVLLAQLAPPTPEKIVNLENGAGTSVDADDELMAWTSARADQSIDAGPAAAAAAAGVSGWVETSAVSTQGMEALRARLRRAVQAAAAAEAAAIQESLGAPPPLLQPHPPPSPTPTRRSRGAGRTSASSSSSSASAAAAALAVASVVEVTRSRAMGMLLVVVVRGGTLRVGQWWVCGNLGGRVRLLLDEGGKLVQTAARGEAVAVGGLSKAFLRKDATVWQTSTHLCPCTAPCGVRVRVKIMGLIIRRTD
jgi:hypothetical protein